MPRVRKCDICEVEFMSYHGIKTCSDQCRAEKRKQQNEKGNKRRYHKESNIPYDKICPICGKSFESLRKKYCSDQCAKKARTIYVKENSDQYYKDHKEDIICKVKASKKNKRERDHKYEICKSNTGFNKTNR
jgi:hypothetical protein